MRTITTTDFALPFVIRGTIAVYVGAVLILAGFPAIGIALIGYAVRSARRAAHIHGIGIVGWHPLDRHPYRGLVATR